MDFNSISKIRLFVIQIHSGHFRRESKDPFIHHLFRIDEFLIKNFSHLKDIYFLRAAALLHDSIEDTWVSKEFLEKKYSLNLANLVYELTKTSTQKDYLKKLKNVSDKAKLIKLIDIYDNVSDGFSGKRWKFFLDESLNIVNILEVKDKNFKKEFDRLKTKVLKLIENEIIK